MKKPLALLGWLSLALMLVVWPSPARAQGGFEPVTPDAFKHAVPTDFYLVGEHIPVEARNAAVLKNPKGARLVVALIDTSGYSSQIQQKYVGMLITETKLSVGTIQVGVGSYGFGLERPAATSNADAKFLLYNQAGEKVGECPAKKDDSIKQPKPLSVTTAKGAPAKLYLGKYALELK
jgi:hypothetical protein